MNPSLESFMIHKPLDPGVIGSNLEQQNIFKIPYLESQNRIGEIFCHYPT